MSFPTFHLKPHSSIPPGVYTTCTDIPIYKKIRAKITFNSKSIELTCLLHGTIPQGSTIVQTIHESETRTNAIIVNKITKISYLHPFDYETWQRIPLDNAVFHSISSPSYIYTIDSVAVPDEPLDLDVRAVRSSGLYVLFNESDAILY